MFIGSYYQRLSEKKFISEAMSKFSIAFFVTLFTSLILHGYGRVQHVLSKEEDLEIERQLKIINKPALKTIKTEYGDIIDCVDINKQPSLDNPLLKNHTIQRRPSFTPPIVQKEAPSRAKSVSVFQNRGCPLGSVPIRRVTKAEIIRSKFSNAPDIYAPPSDRPGSHFSYVRIDKNTFRGARAYIDAYNPRVEDDQVSAAQIWIEAGPKDEVNSIQVGWAVDPMLYGDNRTRLFTYWTGDGYVNTGCYDITCPGFVQIDHTIPLGGAISNVSTINGDQYVIITHVYQDEQTGNWWFMLTDRNIVVGYWPKELFPFFAGGVTTVSYGGRAQGIVNQPSPPMGSGVFPDGNYTHSCFFAYVQFATDFYQLRDPKKGETIGVNDNSGCYGLDNRGWDGDDTGYAVLFGGPGGTSCGH